MFFRLIILSLICAIVMPIPASAQYISNPSSVFYQVMHSKVINHYLSIARRHYGSITYEISIMERRGGDRVIGFFTIRDARTEDAILHPGMALVAIAFTVDPKTSEIISVKTLIPPEKGD